MGKSTYAQKYDQFKIDHQTHTLQNPAWTQRFYFKLTNQIQTLLVHFKNILYHIASDTAVLSDLYDYNAQNNLLKNFFSSVVLQSPVLSDADLV